MRGLMIATTIKIFAAAAARVHKVWKDLKVHKAHKALGDFPDHEEQQARRDHRAAQWVQWAQGGAMAIKARLVQLVPPDQQVREAQLAQQGRLAHKV